MIIKCSEECACVSWLVIIVIGDRILISHFMLSESLCKLKVKSGKMLTYFYKGKWINSLTNVKLFDLILHYFYRALNTRQSSLNHDHRFCQCFGISAYCSGLSFNVLWKMIVFLFLLWTILTRNTSYSDLNIIFKLLGGKAKSVHSVNIG